MKYLLAMFLLIASPAKAEVYDVPVDCAKTEIVLDFIKQEYNEELIFLSEGIAEGNDSLLYSSLWINTETQSWSFIVVNKDNDIACVFAAGKTFQFYEPGQRI